MARQHSSPRSVLLVDDDELFADATAEILRARGFAVETANSLGEAARFDPARFDCVVADHQLPDGSGLTLATRVGSAATRMVLISANPRIEAAIEALRLGFADFLPKPIDLDLLVGALHLHKPAASAQRFDVEASPQSTDPSFQALARSRCPVLITGEAGSGEGDLAHTLHAMGEPDRPFVALNCAAIPSALLESELFGVERGAFTGAETRPGLVELAHGGTLFLDEIGELALALQAKLLTFLDDGIVRRVGGVKERAVRVRVFAATNRDIDAQAAQGAFRADLLHRLDVARIDLVRLRDRQDFEQIAHAVVARLSARDGVDYALAPGEIERLKEHAWPGNVRELQNTIERSSLGSPASALEPSRFVRAARRDADATRAPVVASPGGEDLSLTRVEREHVLRVLDVCGGNRTMAAAALGIGVSTLRRKLAEWSVT